MCIYIFNKKFQSKTLHWAHCSPWGKDGGTNMGWMLVTLLNTWPEGAQIQQWWTWYKNLYIRTDCGTSMKLFLLSGEAGTAMVIRSCMVRKDEGRKEESCRPLAIFLTLHKGHHNFVRPSGFAFWHQWKFAWVKSRSHFTLRVHLIIVYKGLIHN